MKNINIRKLYYRLRHDWLTTNNLVIIVALFIAISWAWGSVSVMNRNYKLQREIDDKNRELKLVQLETETLKFQQRYYQTDEYKELAVRQRLGLIFPGEKALILPPNSTEAKNLDKEPADQPRPLETLSNTEQWLNFLTGHHTENLQ